MLNIAFITCANLSRFFPSAKNALFTHDDQLAVDFLVSKQCRVSPVIWGSPLEEICAKQFDIMILRSPWDYMDNENNRTNFINWLANIDDCGLPLANDFKQVRWNFDKHYLLDLETQNIPIPPTIFLGPNEGLDLLKEAQERWGSIVLKPCISAAARDTYLLSSALVLQEFLPRFCSLRENRDFMVQPFLADIREHGEWSCIFFGGHYSHAVLKKPKAGNWLVQDEQGGSVLCLEPPLKVRDFAEHANRCLEKLLEEKFPQTPGLLYSRIDILPGLMIGEIEIVEPELFFLDRRDGAGRVGALDKFYEGIKKFIDLASFRV